MEFCQYWKGVALRAWRESIALTGWGVPKVFAFRACTYVLALALIWYFWPESDLIKQATARAFILGAGIGALLLVFLGNFVATPHRLNRELSDEIKALRDAGKKVEYVQEIAGRLQKLIARGQKLHERRVQSGHYGIFRGDVVAWFEAAEQQVAGAFPPSEAFMFHSIARKPGPKCDYEDCRNRLSARIDKLRLMTGRYIGQVDTKDEETA